VPDSLALRDLTARIYREPTYAHELRHLDDTGLLALGILPEQLPLIRWLAAALRNFSWVIPGQLAACARQQESVDELAKSGVRTVITLTVEPVPPAWLQHAGITAIHIPIEDFHAPTQDQLTAAVTAIDMSLSRDQPVCVHCAAGRGRTGTVLTAYLIHRGRTMPDALAEVRRLRPYSVESEDQLAALHAYEESGAPG